MLKNAIDYAANEWNNKPAGFVGYGGVGARRAVEQLHLHAVELQMAPVKSAVHIAWGDFLAVRRGEKKLEDLEHLDQTATALVSDVAWWAKVLKAARQADAVAESQGGLTAGSSYPPRIGAALARPIVGRRASPRRP